MYKRQVLRRLREFPPTRGLVVGAFAEASADVHNLLSLVVKSAAARHWREAGAASLLAAISVFTATYRRRWGCEFALQGARLRIARSSLVDGVSSPQDRVPPTSGFDPSSHADFARASEPPLCGAPAGQRDGRPP